jgi:ligand-binding sensor domain-containing protein
MPYFRAMRLLLAIPLLLVSLALSAQRYAFAQWGTDDGLPTSTINDIAEDPLGFLWLATDGAGLVRFDGARFTQPLNPDSLPSPFVTALETDAKGNFWIGTERGPAFYDGSKLKRFSHLPNAPTSRINAILTISETEVWLATRNGLFIWSGTNFKQIPNQEKEVLSLQRIVFSYAHPRLIYTTADGLDGDLRFSEEFKAQVGKTTRIISAGDSILYAGANGVYSGKNGHQLSTLPDVRDALAVNGQIWMASATSGIEVVSPAGKNLINSQSGLQYDRVRCLYKSKSGTIWVGSVSGLSKLSSSALTIYDPSQGLPDARVHSVYTATNGETWAGTATGVSRFSADFSSLTNFGSADGFPEGLVLAIAEDASGTLWFGTERGLASFNDKTFTQHEFADPFVFSLAAVANKLYIGTASGLYVRQGATITQLETQGEGFVQLLQHQNKLLGLSLMGQLFEVGNATITPLKTFGNLPLDTLRIHEIAPLAEGGLAISVQRVGVYVCQNGQCNLLAKPQGLQSLNIKAIATSATNLWIGTERGLYRWPLTQASALQFYGPQSGFLAKECNERSLFTNQNGNLLAGTNSGFYCINEAAFSRKTTNAIFITGVDLLFNPDVDWTAYSDTLMPWTNVPKRLKLGFDQNYLTFFFSSPEAGAENTYVRYKLEGQDKKWTAAGSRNEAVFTNIPANKYTFVVQQSSSPGFETFAEARIEVVIVPPYYRTWWFWTLIAGALTALVFFAVRYRINQLNARLTLEAALADSERKALRLQMNPHFVFNALDAISGFIFNNEPKEAVRYLTSFAKLMRLTLESSRESVVPLHNELQLLKNYIALEELRFNNSFTHTLTVADDVDTYETNIPPMLLQPFVENAILHGLRNREGGGGLLLLDFKCANKRLEVTIEDNGVGRQRAAELNAKRGKTSLATSITAERIDLLSKSLGQPVTLTIKDLHAENGLPSGTRVILSFPMLEDMEGDAA